VNPAVDAWVRSYRPPARRGTTYIALAQLAARANHAGKVPMSHTELAAATGRRKRQAQTLVHQLAAAGMLHIERQFTRTGQQIANVYRLLAPWILAQVEGEARTAELPSEPVAPQRTPALMRRVFADGGCIHQGAPACGECAARA
jgi:hypothetical protein